MNYARSTLGRTDLNKAVLRNESGAYLAVDANTFEQLVKALSSETCQKTM